MEPCAARRISGWIWYFTALVDGAKGIRQQPYLRALATKPLVQVILGKFKLKQVKCRVTLCTYPGSRIFDMPEEKRTDVNIALQLLDDANHNRADQFVIVSELVQQPAAARVTPTSYPRLRWSRPSSPRNGCLCMCRPAILFGVRRLNCVMQRINTRHSRCNY